MPAGHRRRPRSSRVAGLALAGVAVAGVAVAGVGCGKDDRAAPRPSGQLARGGADPEGPCTWVADGTCREHEALFGEALARAAGVAIGAAPVVTDATAAGYYARVDSGGAGFHVTVTAPSALPAGGTRIRIRRWSSRVDGWTVGEDAFHPAAPGASFTAAIAPEPGAQVLVAVVAEPAVAFRVAIAR